MKIRAVFRYLRLPHTWVVPMDGFTGAAGLGEGAPDSGFIGTVYPGGKLVGDKGNVKLRFDDTYMAMAADGKL